MDADKVLSIQEVKANKEFALSLIKDLDYVFHTNFQIEDGTDYTTISIKASSSYNNYGSYTFVASKNGIKFNAKCLGYYSVGKGNDHIKPLGNLYEKYKTSGTTADKHFLEGFSRHGWVEFKIPINRNGDNLLDTLKDIVYILEQNSYKKRF